MKRYLAALPLFALLVCSGCCPKIIPRMTTEIVWPSKTPTELKKVTVTWPEKTVDGSLRTYKVDGRIVTIVMVRP